MLKHSLCLLCGSNALCDNVCAALSPCPFCQTISSTHLTLRRCSVADPTGTVTGGQHCALPCRQKARMLYLEVRLLNLEEKKQKDNARESPGFHRIPRAMEMAPHSHAFPSKPLGMCTVQWIYPQRSDCKILRSIFMLYIVTNPKLVNNPEI